MSEKLIRHSGNYRKLLSYQKTVVIYEMTFFFCQKFLEKGDRTVDQMVQAARSGKQNIIEGCAASATSAKTEIKLVNVAKASLQELLEDYIDYYCCPVNVYILHKVKRFMLYKPHLFFIKNLRTREFLFRINEKKRIIATYVVLEWLDWQERSDISQIL